MALRALTSGWKVEGEISAVGGRTRRWLFESFEEQEEWISFGSDRVSGCKCWLVVFELEQVSRIG